jgi:hypothetical protein
VAGVCYLAMTLMPLVFKRFRGFSERPLEAGRRATGAADV